MSAWGTGLYRSDVAADVKVLFRDLVRLPFSPDRLIEMGTASFAGAAKPDDESYSDFCLALADQCYTFGIEVDWVFARARPQKMNVNHGCKSGFDPALALLRDSKEPPEKAAAAMIG